VDRAARDVSKVLSIPCGGYSQGDIIVEPDIKRSAADFFEHRLVRPRQVIEWNVRDSDAILILIAKWDIGRSTKAI
jgi:hypothetical protein